MIMNRCPSPHMQISVNAGMCSVRLLDALISLDNRLVSACFLAEFWDSTADCEAWGIAHVSEDMQQEFLGLYAWCVAKSSSWARGALDIPRWHRSTASSDASVAIPMPSVSAKRRRYSSTTGLLGCRTNISASTSCVAADLSPSISKESVKDQGYHRALVDTLNLLTQLAGADGLLAELSSSGLTEQARLHRICRSFGQRPQLQAHFATTTCTPTGF